MFCCVAVQLETEDLPTLPNMPQYEVVAIESQTEIDRRKAGMILTLSPAKGPSHDVQTPQDMDDESGSGQSVYMGHVRRCQSFYMGHWQGRRC